MSIDETKVLIHRSRSLAMRSVGRLPGPKSECNYCGQRFRRWGRDYSEGLTCPRCGSIARERVVYEAMLRELTSGECPQIADNPELRGLSVLECSPRTPALRRRMHARTFGEYVASDFDQRGHPGDIELDLTDAHQAANLAGRFDVIILCHVLEHVPNYSSAIRNTAVLLAPGGKVFFQVPLLEAQYTKVMWDEFHSDRTRVYHRFAFDIIESLAPCFSSIVLWVGLLDCPVTSPEVDRAKYEYLVGRGLGLSVQELGSDTLRANGLGCADQCEVLVLGKD